MPYRLFSDTQYVPQDTIRKREQDRRATQIKAVEDQEYKPDGGSPFQGWLDHLRATSNVPEVQPKSGGGGSLLGGLKSLAGNVAGGIANTAVDVAKSATPYDLIKDTLQGHPQDVIADRMQSVGNVLSGRRIASNFGGQQQFERLPELAQTAIDVAPQAGLAAASGGLSSAPKLGVAFAKQLALQTALNEGLQKGSEAAQDVPGWSSLPEPAQQAAIMGGTLLGGHALGKVDIGNTLRDMPRQTEGVKMGARAGLLAPSGLTGNTFIANPGDNLFHGSPRELVGGKLKTTISGDSLGDFGPGPYTSYEDPRYADYYTQTRGNSGSVVGHENEETPGRNISHWTPKKPLGALEWSYPVTEDEMRRINNVLQKKGVQTVALAAQPDYFQNNGGSIWEKVKARSESHDPMESNAFARDVLTEAGFDGIKISNELTVWDPENLQTHIDYRAAGGQHTQRYDDPRVMKEYGESGGPHQMTTAKGGVEDYPIGSDWSKIGNTPEAPNGLGLNAKHVIDSAFETGGIPELQTWVKAQWSLPEEKAYAQQLIDQNTAIQPSNTGVSTLTSGIKSFIDQYVRPPDVPGWLAKDSMHGPDVKAYIAKEYPDEAAKFYASQGQTPPQALGSINDQMATMQPGTGNDFPPSLYKPESPSFDEQVHQHGVQNSLNANRQSSSNITQADAAEEFAPLGPLSKALKEALAKMSDEDWEPTPEELAKQPKIGGGAKTWRDYIPRSLKDINDALRSTNTLFDVAFMARLGPQAGLDHPKLYADAVRRALQGVVDEDVLRQVQKAVDAKAAASPPLPETTPGLPGSSSAGANRWIPNKAEMSLRPSATNNGYGLKVGSGIPTGIVGQIPGVRRLVNVYDNFQNIYRPQLLQLEIENRLAAGSLTPAQLKDPLVRADLGRGVNLLTGRSSLHIGGEANLLLEFPNWLAAQGELIARGLTQNNITGQMARKSLLKLIAVGAAVTTLGQAAQGEGPLEHTRNGIPMLKIPGTDDTVDMFGPLGEVISKISGIAKGGVNEGVGGVATEAFKDYRGLASPVAKLGIDQLTKSDSIGQRVDKPMERLVNLLNTAAPFTGTSVMGAYKGEQNIPMAAAHSLGFRIHQPSPTNEALSNAGIKLDDPDFLIKRKEYIQAHPELANTSDVTDVQKQIASERKALDTQLRSDPSYTLQQFRDARTKILQEQRDKLGVLLGGGNGRPINDTKQAGWLQSYNQLYDQAKNPRDPSGQGVDQQKLDELIGEWSTKNSPEALDFVNRYLGTGLSEAESAYNKDLATLSQAGYFTMPKFRNMSSDLTEQDITDYKQQVMARRSASPTNASVASTVQEMFGQELSAQELRDVINSFKEAYQSKERAALQQQYRKEIQWFSPNANWESYQGATTNPKPTGTSTARGHAGHSLPSVRVGR